MRGLIVMISVFWSVFTFGQEVKLGLPVGEEGSITVSSFSPNSQYLVTNAGNTARIWDVKTGKALHLLKGHAKEIVSVSFCPKNDKILTASEDNTLRVWDLQTGVLLHELIGHEAAITSSSFSPNGELIVSSSKDSTIRIWSVVSGNSQFVLSGHLNIVNKAVFSPNGELVASCSDDRVVRIWDTKTGSISHKLKGHRGDVLDVNFSNDGQSIVSSSRDGLAIIWDVQKGKLSKKLKGHYWYVESAFFSDNDEKVITSAYYDMCLWGTKTGTKLKELKNHKIKSINPFGADGKEIIVSVLDDDKDDLVARILDASTLNMKRDLTEDRTWNSSASLASISPKGNMAITVNNKGLFLWDSKDGVILSKLTQEFISIKDVSFSQNGKHIILNGAGYSANSVVFSLEKGKLDYQLDGGIDCDWASPFSNNGRQLVVNSVDEALIYDVESGKLTAKLESQSERLSNVFFSTNDSFIISVSIDNTITVWDLSVNIGGVFRKIEFDRKIEIEGACPSSDGKLVLVQGKDDTTRVWNIYSGKLVCSFGVDEIQGDVHSASFSYDNAIILTNTGNNYRLWEVKTGRLLKTIVDSDNIKSANLSPKNNYIVTTGYNYTASIWSMSTDKRLHLLSGHTDQINNAIFSSDEKYLVTISNDNSIRIWEVKSGNLLNVLKGHNSEVISAQFRFDENQLITGSNSGSIIIWDFITGEKIIQLYNFFDLYLEEVDLKKSICLTDEGYYSCDKSMSDMVYYTKELQVFPFSQFDLKYNRPDIIHSRLGYASPEKIKSYRRAYEKRLQKMGFTEDMLKADFHLPEASILNEGELPVQTEDDKLKLNINVTDSKYLLDRINVWINNVPIYGVNGISLRDKNTQDYKTEIALQLNEGDNKIEVSVLNQAGAESYNETVYINCTKPAPKPNLYFVGIGVKDYVNEDMNLKFSDKDIRDIAHLYGKNKSYGTVYIDTFLNASATKNILPQIRQRLESTTIHDQVIFMYSGHGILDDSLDYYLTTHDIDFLTPKGKGIPYEAVDELLDNIPARQKLVLIDACNSGEVDKDEMEVDNTTGITAEVVAPKGDMFKKYATKTNSFEMMQELFTDLRRGTGATVISSSSGKYFSFEDKKYQNGVYTYALKLGLEGAADANDDNEITVSELKEYLYTKVETLTNGKQKPTARQENLEYDFVMWKQ